MRQGWRHAFDGYCDHCSWKKLNNWLQCWWSLRCCNQSVHMYQNCLEQSQKHVCNGVYDHYNYLETRLKTIDYNACEACDVVSKCSHVSKLPRTELETCLQWCLYYHYNYIETRLKIIDYNAGKACDVVIKVFTCIKTAWNRVRNMFAPVLTTITTIWRPGLKQLITMLVKLAMLYQSVHMCQNCPGQSWKHVCNGAYTIITIIWRPGLKQLITMLVKLAMLYQSVHMCQNCPGQSWKHLCNGAYTIITTIWRPGLKQLITMLVKLAML